MIVRTPNSRQARITRSAVSPRLATSTFFNIPPAAPHSTSLPGTRMEARPHRSAPLYHARGGEKTGKDRGSASIAQDVYAAYAVAPHWRPTLRRRGVLSRVGRIQPPGLPAARTRCLARPAERDTRPVG